MLHSCKNCGGTLTFFQDASPTPNTPSFMEFFRVFVVCGATTFLLTSSGLYIVGRALDAAGRLALERAREEVTAAGFSYASPPDAFKIKDSENAVLWIRKAERESKANVDRSCIDCSVIQAAVEGNPTAVKLDEARRMSEKRLKSIKLLKIAATKKGVDWGIDHRGWPHPYEPKESDPGHSQLFELGNLIAVRAIIDQYDGKPAQAAEDIRLGLWLARTVDARGDLLGHLIALNIYRRSLEAARVVLPQIRAEAALKAWGAFLKPDELVARFRRAVEIDAFASGENNLAQTSSNSGLVAIWYGLAFLKFDMAASHRLQTALLKTLELPYPLIHANYRKAESTNAVWPLGGILRRMLNIESYNSLNLRDVANLRMALAAIETQRSLERGIIPRSVAGIDPFSGRNLKFKLDSSRATIYSVGPDGQDDGGKPFNYSDLKGDITWQMPLVPSPAPAK